MDATGLAPGAISTFFVKRAHDRGEGFTWRHWLKCAMVVDVNRRFIIVQTARRNHKRATHQDGRKLVVSYERWIITYAGFFHMTCALLTLRRVLK